MTIVPAVLLYLALLMVAAYAAARALSGGRAASRWAAVAAAAAAAVWGFGGWPVEWSAAVLCGGIFMAGLLAVVREPEPAASGPGPPPSEIGGPKGLEPTRYGDWERKGRAIDF